LSDETSKIAVVPDFLRALAQELRPSHVPRDTAIRPTRAGAANAERTFMVRPLSVFLHQAFGSPLFSVVAATVNILVDDATNPLDANHVAKLVADLF
jgi:hypothetical protein